MWLGRSHFQDNSILNSLFLARMKQNIQGMMKPPCHRDTLGRNLSRICIDLLQQHIQRSSLHDDFVTSAWPRRFASRGKRKLLCVACRSERLQVFARSWRLVSRNLLGIQPHATGKEFTLVCLRGFTLLISDKTPT